MKLLKMFSLVGVLALVVVSFQACGSNAPATEQEQQGKEYTSAYVCPMHCEGSGSEDAGKCPVCGMDYVENENHQSDGHTH